MKDYEIYGIFLLICLVAFFCLSGEHMRLMIILEVIGTITIVWLEMNK